MQYIIVITTFFIVIFVAMITIKRLKSGKTELSNTYSFRRQIRISLICLSIIITASLLIYIVSGSFQVAIGIGALLLCAVVSGCLFGLLLEYQAKRRGGRKVD
jgi:O-antigen/teichoic acid export membrane protein